MVDHELHARALGAVPEPREVRAPETPRPTPSPLRWPRGGGALAPTAAHAAAEGEPGARDHSEATDRRGVVSTVWRAQRRITHTSRLWVAVTASAITLVAVETVAMRGEAPVLLAVIAFAVSALLALSCVCHLRTLHSTRALHEHIARTSGDRQRLLADVMRGADRDRHRVAAQLYEQTTSTYIALASSVRLTGVDRVDRGRDADEPVGPDPVLVGARDDLARQAESLRQLMLAIQPLEPEGPARGGLDTSVRAYLDSLYGSRSAPVLDVVVDDVHLDWTTETVVLRIIQEALRNVWRHADAGHVGVRVVSANDALVVEVTDDGVGFDPAATLFESGIATMRSFASFSDGAVLVTSAPGEGTTVEARFGDPAWTVCTPAGRAAPRSGGLCVIQGGRASGV